MDTAIVLSRATLGMQAPQVTIETHLSRGLPGFSIVGLPETAVKESRDRVRSSIINSHFIFPTKKITVNLAPADLPKYGSRFDLPIALSILVADGQLDGSTLTQYEFAGELALSGELRLIRCVLPFAMCCKHDGRELIIPKENAAEAALVKKLSVFPATSLIEVCSHITGYTKLLPYQADLKEINATEIKGELDLADVRGQSQAKRALEIAAAGGHNLLFFGSPGTGKSMIASRLPGILPNMTEQEALDVAAVASLSTQGFKLDHFGKRSFRRPHHTASSIALVGGGNPPKPGEISLAHQGVLFLDELPEFSRHVLEALREPLESGTIVISRAGRQVEFPAKIQLIAAMNPCPCGYLGDPEGRCNCTKVQIQKYRMRISGPLLDRIDMHLEVMRVADDVLTGMSQEINEPSKKIKERVEAARAIQLSRNQCINAELNGTALETFCKLGEPERALLQTILKKMKLSARSYHRVLRVARTIADLGISEHIHKNHILEAVSFRNFDRQV